MFEFAAPTRVVFGPGTVRRLGELTAGLGTRVLVVTGRTPDRVAAATATIDAAGGRGAIWRTAGEPTTETVAAGVQAARAHRADVIVAIGGGSALDSGKAIAAMAANEGDLFDYLETIGRARPLARPALPIIAVPTTAGTGSEVTRNAVVASPEHRVKVSLRDASMTPRIAIVDPELALGLDAATTAATGLDALTQLIEPFVSRRRHPIVDALTRDGLPRVGRGLERAVRHGADIEARSDMALSALWSGLSLVHAGLGAVHGLAGPLGGWLNAPHGALCAALLPAVMQANLEAARRADDAETTTRFDEVAQMLTGRQTAGADDGIRWVRNVTRDFGIPRLANHGLQGADMPAIVDAARRASSMKSNPFDLSQVELSEILASS